MSLMTVKIKLTVKTPGFILRVRSILSQITVNSTSIVETYDIILRARSFVGQSISKDPVVVVVVACFVSKGMVE